MGRHMFTLYWPATTTWSETSCEPSRWHDNNQGQNMSFGVSSNSKSRSLHVALIASMSSVLPTLLQQLTVLVSWPLPRPPWEGVPDSLKTSALDNPQTYSSCKQLALERVSTEEIVPVKTFGVPCPRGCSWFASGQRPLLHVILSPSFSCHLSTVYLIKASKAPPWNLWII